MNNQKKEDEIVLRQLYEDFLRSGLTEEIDEFVSYFQEPYAGIGMGEQGIVHSKAEMESVMRESFRPKTGLTTDYSIKDFIINFLNEDAAVVCGCVIVASTSEGGEAIHSGIMQTIAVRRRGDKWSIGFTHASPMLLSEESIEAYPIKFADHTISSLRAELQTDTFDMINENFSGGIFGTFAADPFPLFFANDRFIEMMGYEREEFEETYKDGTTRFNYVDDASDMEEKSRKALVSDMDYVMTTRFVRKDESVFWVELQTRKSKDNEDKDILLVIVTDITAIITLQKEAQKQHKTILDSINYAGKIQRNLLPREAEFEKAFSDYSIIWEPRDIVGGDIYWLKNFSVGTVLCVCDCTGHGTPGALLTMLVVSAFEASVKERNCADTASILWDLEKRLVSALNVEGKRTKGAITDFSDGCDIAVVFIGQDGMVKISAGNTSVFVCDGTEVRRIKGQRLFIGEGSINSREDIHTETVAYHPDNKFYIASDGLFDQICQNSKKFGYSIFRQIILSSHKKKMKDISREIWQAFESSRGNESRRDDVELITFRPFAETSHIKGDTNGKW